MKKQQGFTLIEGLLVFAAIAIVIGVGYMAYTHLIAPQTSTLSASPSPTPLKIEKAADLDKASTTLDSTALDDSDTSQLDNLTGNF